MHQFDTIIIGAGILGLACAAACAKKNHNILIVEATSAFGTGISSRNSEVIHAGIYYPQNSLKAKACVKGNELLQDYAKKHHVPYHMVGKLIVATNEAEEETLAQVEKRAVLNNAKNITAISRAQALAMEPALHCTAALYSPNTGIIDTHAFMLSLLGKAQDRGAMIVYNCPVIKGAQEGDIITLHMGDEDKTIITTKNLIIAAGLQSCAVAKACGLQNIPAPYLCKGDYFSLSGRAPFSHLVYPVPVPGGLGIHYTLDLNKRGRFGPDVTWIDEEFYDVAGDKAALFAQSIQRYWPACRAEYLHPAYAGIRPKIVPQGTADADFMILDETHHQTRGVIALLGIESPGVTSSLALARMVAQRIKELA